MSGEAGFKSLQIDIDMEDKASGLTKDNLSITVSQRKTEVAL